MCWFSFQAFVSPHLTRLFSRHAEVSFPKIVECANRQKFTRAENVWGFLSAVIASRTNNCQFMTNHFQRKFPVAFSRWFFAGRIRDGWKISDTGEDGERNEWRLIVFSTVNYCGCFDVAFSNLIRPVSLLSSRACYLRLPRTAKLSSLTVVVDYTLLGLLRSFRDKNFAVESFVVSCCDLFSNNTFDFFAFWIFLRFLIVLGKYLQCLGVCLLWVIGS